MAPFVLWAFGSTNVQGGAAAGSLLQRVFPGPSLQPGSCRSSTAILHLWVNPQSRPFLEMADVREERDSEENSKKLEHRGESGNQAKGAIRAFDPCPNSDDTVS